MGEQIKEYFRFYNSYDDYYSKPMTKKQIMNEIESCLNSIGNGKVVAEITTIYLSDTELKEGNLQHFN